MNIIVPSTNMKSKPTGASSLETECLFGEKVELLEEYRNSVFCKLLTDNYCGWIDKRNLGYLNKPTHRVLAVRTYLCDQENVKSNFIHYIPLGSLLSIKKINNNWAEVNLSNKHFSNKAYVPNKHIVKIDHKVTDWVAIAEQLTGIPYKWGGRDTIAIDCSSLLQLSCQTYGLKIPRNTKDQINIKGETIKDINNLKRGHVIFWRGHVGIMVDSSNILHANAFHMKTVIEPLRDVIIRMKNNFEILKIINLQN